MPHFVLPNADEDFARVRSSEGRGLYASASPLFRDAIFGRDSLESAEDLLEFMPEIAKEVILSLASLQGTLSNAVTEEEPGRIHHEYRNVVMDGRRIPMVSEEILHRLAAMWGGTESEVIYYGTVDATPLFIRLVERYVAQEGAAILDERVTRRDGGVVTIRESVLDALSWLVGRLDSSELGLLEFCRTNPHGHAYQVWKDGTTGYMHANGKMANVSQPVASIEVQGLAYDALLAGCELFPHHHYKVGRWKRLARRLQQVTLQRFWMPKHEYFALALDRDKGEKVRQVETWCSNPATLLETRLLDNLPEVQKRRAIKVIVGKIYSKEFLTDAGIRCRAVRHSRMLDFASYHGMWAVWAKETYDIAKGLRGHGFGRLADQLEIRILNASHLSGRHFEFWYVHADGRVHYDPQARFAASRRHEIIAGTHVPEDVQAWTISAVKAIHFYHQNPGRRVYPQQADWQYKLEEQLLRKHTQLALLMDAEQVAKAYPRNYSFTVDVKLGKRRRDKYLGIRG